MALLFCDSFDHYATANILTKWTAQVGSQTIDPSYGRNGSGMRNQYGDQWWIKKSLGVSRTTLICGGAFRFATAGTGCGIFVLFDDTHEQIGLLPTLAGELAVLRAASWDYSLGITSGLGLLPNAWYFIEFKVTIGSGTSGSFEVRVNGVNVLSNAGCNTQQTENAYAALVRTAGSGGFGSACDIDDFYVCDNQGTYNNDFLGDIRVVAQLPNANGSNVAWAASAGTDVSCVDEAAPNDDTDYLSSLTPDALESFAFPALGITGTVKAVQTLLYARKDDAGSRSIAEYCLSAGTGAAGATQALGDSYLYYREIREVDPAAAPAAAWTVSGVDAAEAGAKLVS